MYVPLVPCVLSQASFYPENTNFKTKQKILDRLSSLREIVLWMTSLEGEQRTQVSSYRIETRICIKGKVSLLPDSAHGFQCILPLDQIILPTSILSLTHTHTPTLHAPLSPCLHVSLAHTGCCSSSISFLAAANILLRPCAQHFCRSGLREAEVHRDGWVQEWVPRQAPDDC